MNSPIRLLFVLVIAFLAAPSFARQDGQSPRERWEHMSPEERARIQDRFEHFKKLPPEQRQSLTSRAARLEQLRSEFLSHMSPELRAKLAKLSPLERREVLRTFLEQHLVERGRRMGEMLPQELREKLDKAAPEDRPRLMHEFFEHERRERGDRMIDHVAKELSLAPTEVERIKGLPDDQRFAAMFDLHRKLVVHEVESHGLPTWIQSGEWSEMQKLSTPEFFERLHSLRRERAPDSDSFGESFGEGKGGGRFHGGPGGRFGFVPPAVRELLRPDPEWMIELSKLPPLERRAAIDQRIHDRILKKLAELPDVATPAEVEHLRTLSGREFFEGLHELARKHAPARSARAHENWR